jgi:hypothetical protein
MKLTVVLDEIPLSDAYLFLVTEIAGNELMSLDA